MDNPGDLLGQILNEMIKSENPNLDRFLTRLLYDNTAKGDVGLIDIPLEVITPHIDFIYRKLWEILLDGLWTTDVNISNIILESIAYFKQGDENFDRKIEVKKTEVFLDEIYRLNKVHDPELLKKAGLKLILDVTPMSELELLGLLIELSKQNYTQSVLFYQSYLDNPCLYFTEESIQKFHRLLLSMINNVTYNNETKQTLRRVDRLLTQRSL